MREQRPAASANPFRFLYTHNPFYLISTFCVLFAIQRGFRPETAEYLNPWLLMAALSSLTLLMAVTGWVIVRFGKVWEDARSILLVVVLMFLAMSVSFDEVLNLWATTVISLLAFGFVFSVLITESLVRGLRISFPWSFRLPFYTFLALFFAVPVWLSPEVTDLGITATRWRIAAFPLFAAAATLLLIPGIRSSSRRFAANGTPWRWPWYPWTVFVVLGVAVCARTYSLTISFDSATGSVRDMHSMFGPYMLVPFLLAVLAVLLEIGIVEGSARLRSIACAAAPLLMAFAFHQRFDPTFRQFQSALVREVASPAYLTILGVGGFYAYAMVRRIRFAEFGLAMALAGAAVIGPRTTHWWRLADPSSAPLIVLCGMLFISALWKRSSFRCVLSSLAGACILWIEFDRPELNAFRVAGASHVLLLACLIIGVIFDDLNARRLLSLTAFAVPPLSLTTARFLQTEGVPDEFILIYLIGMTTLLFTWWAISRNRWLLRAALLHISAGFSGVLLLGFGEARRRFDPQVLQPMLYGGASFLIAALISAHKAGWYNQWSLWKRLTSSAARSTVRNQLDDDDPANIDFDDLMDLTGLD